MTSLERQIDKCRRAAEEHPEDLDTLMAYAQICLRRDLRLEALQVFQRVLEVEPRAEARLALARLFARQGHHSEAYGELRRLFEAEPSNVLGHALLLWLRDHEAVPADLEPELGFIPCKEALAETREGLESERDILAGEVDQYRALAAGPDPEPILLYHLEESRRRVERVIELLERVEGWEHLAEEAPPVPTPELVAPQDEEAPEEGVEEAVVEPVEEALEPLPSGPSEDRLAFYAQVAGPVADSLGRIGQTRGVTGSLVMADDPWLVRQVGQDSDLSGALDPVAEGCRALVAFGEGLQYWVLECENGIVVVQRLDARHLLVVVGKTGANFGSLRYAIDKNRMELADLLAGTPAA